MSHPLRKLKLARRDQEDPRLIRRIPVTAPAMLQAAAVMEGIQGRHHLQPHRRKVRRDAVLQSQGSAEERALKA